MTCGDGLPEPFEFALVSKLEPLPGTLKLCGYSENLRKRNRQTSNFWGKWQQ